MVNCASSELNPICPAYMNSEAKKKGEYPQFVAELSKAHLHGAEGYPRSRDGAPEYRPSGNFVSSDGLRL